MRTTRKLLPRAVLAALLLALPAAADAPRDPPQYDRFDGDTLVIKDNFTKLEWDRFNVFTKRDQTFVDGGCALVTSLGNLGRLPTVKELLTLVDEEPHPEYEGGKNVTKMIDQPAFDGTPIDLPYWTSTPGPQPDTFWTVSFANGAMVAMPKTAMANARCVR